MSFGAMIMSPGGLDRSTLTTADRLSWRLRSIARTTSRRSFSTSTRRCFANSHRQTAGPGARCWGPAHPSFPAPLSDYRTARRLFQRACLDARLHDGGRNASGVPKPNATIHDLRHTFGVHCAQAGVPTARSRTLRAGIPAHDSPYMKHTPDSPPPRTRRGGRRGRREHGVGRPRRRSRWRGQGLNPPNSAGISPQISPHARNPGSRIPRGGLHNCQR